MTDPGALPLFFVPSLVTIFLIFSIIPPCLSISTELYRSCSKQTSCGDVIITYPFWGQGRVYECGNPELEVTCDKDIAFINLNSLRYRVVEINYDGQVLTIARQDFLDGICPPEFVNTSLDPSLFENLPGFTNITFLYGCLPSAFPVPSVFTCIVTGSSLPGGYISEGANGPGQCFRSVYFPVSVYRAFEATLNISAAEKVLSEGFEVRWKIDNKACSECVRSEGACGNNPDTNQTICFCPNQSVGSSGTCSSSSSPEITPMSPAQTIARNSSLENLIAALYGGFELQWHANNALCDSCKVSGGLCGSNPSSGEFACYCLNQPYPSICSNTTSQSTTGGSSKTSLGIGLGVAGAAVVGIGLGVWILFIVQRRKRKAVAVLGKDEPTPPVSSKGSKSITTPSANFSETTSSYLSTKSTDIEKGSTYFGVQVFRYTDLEQATEHFNSSRELGDGGFGTVYYGVLQDGRVVAVKRLYENNMRRAEQFMNEIKILAHLRHQNLVTLYGCTSRHSRELLLVYEYIPNGTVADHLNGKMSQSGVLTWPVRLSIAIETAEALAFLHAKEVIHRDVKTNNILLDNNFCVKVADFGLSRLFPNDKTHVSTAPQGTPGYVDPEYYQSYQLTDKSDVYSFGVVLIELISSLPAVDTNRHRQDINLANMAVKKIQNHSLNELIDPSLGFETDDAVRRMATSVAELAFRCLQQERDMRPTMEEVLEALKKLENENYGAEKVEIVDIGDDDVGLLRNLPPPLSPDSATSLPSDKWDKMVKTF